MSERLSDDIVRDYADPDDTFAEMREIRWGKGMAGEVTAMARELIQARQALRNAYVLIDCMLSMQSHIADLDNALRWIAALAWSEYSHEQILRPDNSEDGVSVFYLRQLLATVGYTRDVV